jgi:hypothetical protein
MKRLMIMRKIRENSDLDEKMSIAQPENTMETLNDEEEMQEYHNQTRRHHKRLISPSYRAHSNLRNEKDR